MLVGQQLYGRLSRSQECPAPEGACYQGSTAQGCFRREKDAPCVFGFCRAGSDVERCFGLRGPPSPPVRLGLQGVDKRRGYRKYQAACRGRAARLKERKRLLPSHPNRSEAARRILVNGGRPEVASRRLSAVRPGPPVCCSWWVQVLSQREGKDSTLCERGEGAEARSRPTARQASHR